MITNWKELLESHREKTARYYSTNGSTTVADTDEHNHCLYGHASLEPLLLKAIETLEKLTIYSDLGGRISGEALAEIREELESKMTEDEKALELALNTIKCKIVDGISTQDWIAIGTAFFLAGIAHQRTKEDDAVKSFIEFANKFDDYTIHSRNKCESYNNCTCGLTKLRQDFKQAIETYNKVRGV